MLFDLYWLAILNDENSYLSFLQSLFVRYSPGRKDFSLRSISESFYMFK